LTDQPQAASATGATLALGLIGSTLAALPGWLRVTSVGEPFGAAFALAGASSLVVIPVALWLRHFTRAGTRADRALLSGAALSALPLALFGGVLKSTTHHRPLGGATFAVVALGLLALCVGLAFRVFRGGGAGREPVKATWQNLFTLGCGLSLVLAVSLGLAHTARPSLVDFLALALAAAGGGRLKMGLGLSRLRAWPLLAGWGVLLTCSVVSIRSPELSRALTAEAPVSFAALSWLGGGS
jgi:hypothetical protein